MIRPHRRLVLLLAALATGPAAAAADDPAPKPIVLFDGKSLDGWKTGGFTGGATVRVQEGALILPAGEPMTGVTTTRTDLPTTDYELTYEARKVEGGDFFAAATFPVGKSFLTFVNGGWGGQVTGLSSLNGADASENETTSGHEYKMNRWYRFRVRVTDKVVRCWIDDEVVVDLNHQDLKLGTRIEVRPNQPLGFASYETTGAIRKVEVRKLTPAEVAATKPKPVD